MDDELEMEITGDDDMEFAEVPNDAVPEPEVVETYFANIDGVSPVPDGDSMAFDLTISVTKSGADGLEVRHTIRRITVNAQSLFDKAAAADETAIVVEGKAEAKKQAERRLINEMRANAGLEPIRG